MFKNIINRMFETKTPKFSLDRLKQLHVQLRKHREVTEENQDIVVETLRSISEVIVWGDQNDPSIWEFFLENNILEYFFNVLEQRSSTISIKKQLLQALSIMIQNINTKNSIYFLLSNNKVNELIAHKFDFNLDEELLAYYITFLKTISLKLDSEMVQFFFDKDNNKFQLYERAIEYADSKENMIQIAVRTITLNIYSVKDIPMYQFIREASDEYFKRMALYTWDQFLRISMLVSENSLGLGNVCADMLDHLWYLGDVFQSSIAPYIEDKLRNILMQNAVEPFLKDDNIQFHVKLFFTSQMFLVFTFPTFVNDMFQFIFNNWLMLPQMENILKSGNENEIDALSGIIYAILTNKGITPKQLQQLEFYKVLKREDIVQWSPIVVTLNASDEYITLTMEQRELDSEEMEIEHPESDVILCEKNERWICNLLSVCLDFKLDRIVSYHLLFRVLNVLNVKLDFNQLQLVSKALKKNEVQLYKKYQTVDFIDFCNYIGLQIADYNQLSNLKGDHLFGDPMLLLSNPPSSLPFHSRPPINEAEQLPKIMHLFILWSKMLPLTNEELLAVEFIGHLGTPKPEGAQIPLPHNMTYVHCVPYQDYNIIREHKNKKYGVVLDSYALYFVDAVGCPPGFAKISMAMPLFFTKCSIEKENKYAMRVTCSQKNSCTTTVQLFDQLVIFDDIYKCERGRNVINKAIIHSINERRRTTCKLFCWFPSPIEGISLIKTHRRKSSKMSNHKDVVTPTSPNT